MKKCLAILSLLCFCEAGCTAIYLKSDLENPCSSTNSIECDKWKKNYPKEYSRYVERMKKGSDPKSSVLKNSPGENQQGAN